MPDCQCTCTRHLLVAWQALEVRQKEKVNMDFGVVVTARDLFEKYKKFVENNIETVGHLESAARILSYVVPGSVCCDDQYLLQPAICNTSKHRSLKIRTDGSHDRFRELGSIGVLL